MKDILLLRILVYALRRQKRCLIDSALVAHGLDHDSWAVPAERRQPSHAELLDQVSHPCVS